METCCRVVPPIDGAVQIKRAGSTLGYSWLSVDEETLVRQTKVAIGLPQEVDPAL